MLNVDAGQGAGACLKNNAIDFFLGPDPRPRLLLVSIMHAQIGIYLYLKRQIGQG